MARNDSTAVAAAREAAAKLGRPMVILLWIDPAKDEMGYASFGETRKLCDTAKTVADFAYEAVYDHIAGKKEPSQ
jgi:hypothetical protein